MYHLNHLTASVIAINYKIVYLHRRLLLFTLSFSRLRSQPETKLQTLFKITCFEYLLQTSQNLIAIFRKSQDKIKINNDANFIQSITNVRVLVLVIFGVISANAGDRAKITNETLKPPILKLQDF